MMFVINLYTNNNSIIHEDEFNIFNSPLISLCVCGSTNFGLNQHEYNRVYNEKSEIDMPEYSILILTFAFCLYFRYGILRHCLMYFAFLHYT